MLPADIIEIICMYLHSDLVPVENGYMLSLRRCTAFEIRYEDGRQHIFPCVPS